MKNFFETKPSMENFFETKHFRTYAYPLSSKHSLDYIHMTKISVSISKAKENNWLPSN
jgi:hypothetical protein